jgi:hypothetical protein
MQALEGWGTFPSITIANPAPIADLAGIALSDLLPAAEVLPAWLSASHCLCSSTEHNLHHVVACCTLSWRHGDIARGYAQVAQAAARVEESLLQHAGDLARGVGLGIDVASRALTALPLLLPAFMPSQRGLPTLLMRLAEILRRPSGPDDVEGQAEVG